MSVSVALAERGMVPLPALRYGIRRLLRKRLGEVRSGSDTSAFLRMMDRAPLAVATDLANEQHYELPSAFFESVLGPRLKYSGAFWPPGTDTLAEAELRMLEVTVERAQIEDGQRILELGCGWGSLTLYMAECFPGARITAVSNSATQRAYIEARAPANLTVVTADVRDYAPLDSFDRVVSIEMFEHMRNHAELLRRIRNWLRPGGRLFVHLFCHREVAYPFETTGQDDWMGRHFFTGGVMPSFDLLRRCDRDMVQERSWAVSGVHYMRTARAWRKKLEARRAEVLPVLEEHYGPDAGRWYHRWRLFFLACEELFGYGGGQEWMVGHFRFAARESL
jgi:cyclopropane-fatty-acyl-phospholipid synthase